MAKRKINMKGIIALIVAAVVLIGGLGSLGWYLDSRKNNGNEGNNGGGNSVSNTAPKVAAIEFGGMGPLIKANGNKLNGNLVDLQMVADYDKIMNGITAGEFQGGWTTLDGLLCLLEGFKSAKTDVQVVLLLDKSVGADGLLGIPGVIDGIKDLPKATNIGITQYLPADFLLKYLLLTNDTLFSATEKSAIQKAIKPFSDPGLAGTSFIGNLEGKAKGSEKLDVVGTWQPQLGEAIRKGAKALFTTKQAPDLIVDVLFFEKSYIEKNPRVIENIMDEYFTTVNNGGSWVESIQTLEGYASMGTDEIVASLDGVLFTGYNENRRFFDETYKTTFMTAMEVWSADGVTGIAKDYLDTLFYKGAIDALDSKWANKEVVESTKAPTEPATKPVAVEEDGEVSDALLVQGEVYVQFKPDSNAFLNFSDATEELDKYVATAKALSGTYICIDGYIAPVSGVGKQFGTQLSEDRALAIKNYFVSQGIAATRIFIEGHGSENPVKNSNGTINMDLSRRAVISFMNMGA